MSCLENRESHAGQESDSLLCMINKTIIGFPVSELSTHSLSEIDAMDKRGIPWYK